jgi:hypothetical protein
VAAFCSQVWLVAAARVPNWSTLRPITIYNPITLLFNLNILKLTTANLTDHHFLNPQIVHHFKSTNITLHNFTIYLSTTTSAASN